MIKLYIKSKLHNHTFQMNYEGWSWDFSFMKNTQFYIVHAVSYGQNTVTP